MIEMGVRLPALDVGTTIPSCSPCTVTVDCTGATSSLKLSSEFDSGPASIAFVTLWNPLAETVFYIAQAEYLPTRSGLLSRSRIPLSQTSPLS